MHITLEEAQSFLEGTKCNLTDLEVELEAEQAGYVLGRAATVYPNDVANWTDETTTPRLVRIVIAMFYAGWFYDRQYSEMVAAESGRTYGSALRANAETMLQGIVTGSIEILDIPPADTAGPDPVFYPTDTSSTVDVRDANTDPNDKSFGPAFFSVGMKF